ncbi:thioesterase family protein [Ferrimonas pelagia]|uniref:Thioesterase family protein n=1 Tax=Ferrimonas pelagia TaxID=1177826 RepID=A0ABP9EEH0_9GAMM
MEQFKQDYPVWMEQQVAWGEMDALNHINNVVYFRYFENIRIHFFRRFEFMESLMGQRLAPILSETQCRYRRPVTFPDQLLLGTRITQLSDDRLSMEYAVYSQAQQCITTLGSATVVCVDTQTGRPSPLPMPLASALKASPACRC